MIITDKERQRIEDRSHNLFSWEVENFSRKLADFITEGIGGSFWYDDNEEVNADNELAWSLARRALEELAETRDLQVSREPFSLEEMLHGESDSLLELISGGFDINLFKSKKDLINYLREQTRGMTAKEVESYASTFNWAVDTFREFIAEFTQKGADVVNQIIINNQPTNIWDEDVSNDASNIKNRENEIDNEFVLRFIRFLISLPLIREYRKNGIDAGDALEEIKKQKVLEFFESDPQFSRDFERIMGHDKKTHRYWFHGTQCVEDAISILKQGLGMTREELESTAYTEFDKEQLLLYSRGFGGEIGRDAIVIIDEPVGQNIVQEKKSGYKINFVPSGLQGLNGDANYIIMPEHIVGFVNKRDRSVVFNPLYHDFARSNQNPENATLFELGKIVERMKKTPKK